MLICLELQPFVVIGVVGVMVVARYCGLHRFFRRHHHHHHTT